jgi:hypothetical protein
MSTENLDLSTQGVVALCTVSAQRHGQHWSTPEVHVWRVANGRPWNSANTKATSKPKTSSGRNS